MTLDSFKVVDRVFIDVNIPVGTGAQTLFLTPTTYALGSLLFNLMPGNFYTNVVLNLATCYDFVEYTS